MYHSIIRPILFKIDPERVHHLVFKMVKFGNRIPLVSPLIRGIYQVNDARLEKEVFGIKFPNPVGLAAGFDKDAKLYNELSNFGFGFIEIGTLTPKAQPGNEKPRLFRLPADSGLINRMGFNNGGVEEAVVRLRNRKTKAVIGGNIGKNKVTPNEMAVDDYILAYHALFDVVDYFVVNVSSPNTPNLRALQDKEPLTFLLNTLMAENAKKVHPKPILLKIAPDLTDGQLQDIVDITKETGIHGVIATNTTIDRSNLKTKASDIENIGAGGLSGKPLRSRSTAVVKYLCDQLEVPVIAVGGIFTAEDALEKLEAGAALVQVYTGFIYEGPGIVKRILKGILAKA